MKTRIVIEIWGGLIQSVKADRVDGVEVLILDFDTDMYNDKTINVFNSEQDEPCNTDMPVVMKDAEYVNHYFNQIL